MQKWSEEKLREYNNCQAEEIEKHKWIESEKAGYDVGEVCAAIDWVSKYAMEFRENWTKE